jgi:CRP/FNR family transcriptional regulator, cyclic AMP receptor protein
VSTDSTDWQARRDLAVAHRPEATALHTFLLDVDDELAEQFDVRTRLAVRQATTVKVLEASPGACDLGPTLAQLRDGFGVLLIDGLLSYETRVGERTAAELLGAGDLIPPPVDRSDALLDKAESWRALWPTRFGLLDREFAERVRPFPQIAQALLRRADRRTVELDTIRAITCHPRLEVRLDLIFWQLAGRWGRVEPNGIRMTLPLTHRLLGQLVAAERPSISHALARLSQAGLVTGQAGDWHLVGTPDDHLEALIERTVRLAPRPARRPGGGPRLG